MLYQERRFQTIQLNKRDKKAASRIPALTQLIIDLVELAGNKLRRPPNTVVYFKVSSDFCQVFTSLKTKVYQAYLLYLRFGKKHIYNHLKTI